MARKSIAKWIDEALTDRDKDGPISAIALVHMVGQQRQELHTIKMGATGNYTGEALEKILKGKAETYAQDLDGVQTFALLAFYGGTDTPQAILPFKVLADVNPGTAGLATEPPTAEGRVQQQMRWNDTLLSQVYARQAAMDNHAIRMMEQQNVMLQRSQAMLDKVMADNMEGFTIIKELLNERAIGQHNHAMEQLKYQRNTQEREKILKFAPVLINTILGKEIFPQSMADTALIESIAENLDESMIGKLAEVGLPQELMGPLAARVMKAMEDKEKREAAASKVLPAYKGPAEEDIGGGT
jgi:hypothetical protein